MSGSQKPVTLWCFWSEMAEDPTTTEEIADQEIENSSQHREQMPRTQSHRVLRDGPPLMKQFTSMIEDVWQVLRRTDRTSQLGRRIGRHKPVGKTRQTTLQKNSKRKIRSHFGSEGKGRSLQR